MNFARLLREGPDGGAIRLQDNINVLCKELLPVAPSFHLLKQNALGALLLQDGASYLVAQTSATLRVQAIAAGTYKGDYKDIGDVFDIGAYDIDTSTGTDVPPFDPAYPIYGWMKVVPSTTPLFSWAASGNSSPRGSPRRTVV